MNRKLHNTFSALSVSAALLTAGLIAAAPVAPPDRVATTPQSAIPAPGSAVVHAGERLSRDAERAAQVRAEALERTAVARAQRFEARAEALAAKLQGNQNIGDIIGQVAGFTAEVATEAALSTAIEELTSAQTIRSDTAPPAPASKPRHSRRSLVMPYFSFANRG